MKDSLLPVKIAGIVTWASISLYEITRAGWTQTGLEYAVVFVGYIAIYLFLASGVYDKKLWAGRFLLLIMWLLLYYLVWRIQDSLTPALFVVWAAILGRFVSIPIAQLLILCSCLLLIFPFLQIMKLQDACVNVGLNFGFQFFAMSISSARVAEKQSRERAEDLNNQLLATRALLAQHSQQEERLRIARDLHDILGHQLTGLSLHLEILQHKVAKTHKADVQQVQDIAKDLLEKIRQVVRAQRESAQLDIRQAAETVFDNLPQITCEMHGQLKVKSTAMAEDLLLCLREAVSNAIRHGHATELQIYFLYEIIGDQSNNFLKKSLEKISLENLPKKKTHAKIKILIEDNGKGIHAPIQSGSGLRGIKERMAAYQGQVDLQARPTYPADAAGAPIHSGARLTIECTEVIEGADVYAGE